MTVQWANKSVLPSSQTHNKNDLYRNLRLCPSQLSSFQQQKQVEKGTISWYDIWYGEYDNSYTIKQTNR